ncbi:twitch domain-containing radical SAM protein [Halobacteriovorax sp. HLS]|uniref:twitch domain-containing radical SAM protein n=1 Tax=Halobacteriovorax sp. HLS TaxID=2234000 RepID=UPI000FD8956A|nr:twitch domain-containing radical SAM protein [Halobacteriovorax sp. HLS]
MEGKFLCPFPWMQISTEPEGSVRACCYGDSGKTLGLDVNSTFKISDAQLLEKKINHPELVKLRKSMLSGEIPNFCNGCKRREDVGENSPRRIFLDHYEKEFEILLGKTNLNSGELAVDDISLLELTLGNTCNLKCRSCSPYFSSTLEKEFEQLGIDFSKENVQEIQAFWKQGKLIDSLILLSREVRELKFLGGEPLVTPIHNQLLSILIEKNLSSNMSLTYNTNLTLISDDILSKWSKFKSIKLDISIDGVGELNEYLRFPMKWEKFEKNLEKIFNEKDDLNIEVSFNTVFQAYNIPFIIDLLEYLKPLSKKCPIVPYFIYLDYPYYLKGDVLKVSVLEEIKQRLSLYYSNNEEFYKNTLYGEKNLSNFSLLFSLLDLSILENRTENYFDFIMFTKKLDKLRKQNYFRFLK